MIVLGKYHLCRGRMWRLGMHPIRAADIGMNPKYPSIERFYIGPFYIMW